MFWEQIQAERFSTNAVIFPVYIASVIIYLFVCVWVSVCMCVYHTTWDYINNMMVSCGALKPVQAMVFYSLKRWHLSYTLWSASSLSSQVTQYCIQNNKNKDKYSDRSFCTTYCRKVQYISWTSLYFFHKNKNKFYNKTLTITFHMFCLDLSLKLWLVLKLWGVDAFLKGDAAHEAHPGKGFSTSYTYSVHKPVTHSQWSMYCTTYVQYSKKKSMYIKMFMSVIHIV